MNVHFIQPGGGALRYDATTIGLSAKRTAWLASGIVSAATIMSTVYGLALRRWHLRWNATAAEVRRRLPGDELVPHPKMVSTRAITIGAPAAEVWPWIVQMGADRGGLYSYDWLENVFGMPIHNVDRIVPQLQNLELGDIVALVPNNALPLKVTTLDRGHALVLAGGTDEAAPAAIWVWAFVLNPIDEWTTRLVVRSRLGYAPSVINTLVWRVFIEPAHFIMEQKMLRGIKQRAETAVDCGQLVLDRYLPVFDARMRQRVVVQAELEDVYAAARDLDFAHALSSPMIRGLGALRALPVRVAGRLRRRGEAGTAATEIRDDARVVNAPPFIILDEQAGTEIVFGMIGQFMRATKMEFARIRPEEFAPFDRPGFGKVAFNLRVQPYGRGKSLLTSETRTATTDPTSRAQFRRYWCVVGPGADFIMRRLLAALKVDAERRHASR